MKASILALLIAVGPVNAQTTSHAPATNSAAITTNSAVAVQFEAVRKAMPQYFSITTDPVTEHKTIEMLNYDHAAGLNGSSLTYDVVCFLNPGQKVPDEISLHFLNRSEDWEFLHDSDFTLRYDTNRLNFGKLKIQGKVEDDATVLEQCWADFSLDQFRQIAWSDDVVFKIGWRNFSISYAQRQKWKLLWKYFDLQQPKPSEIPSGF